MPAATYADPQGDGGTAPDITSVIVSTDTTGQITFRVNVAQLKLLSGERLVIAIDTDQDPLTGDEGIDLVFVGDLSRSVFAFVTGRWLRSRFVPTHMPTAVTRIDGTGLSFSVSASDLGIATGFSFYVRTLAGNRVTRDNHDDAPDNGEWSFPPESGPRLTLALDDPVTTKARSGRRFIAFVTVARSDGRQAEVTYGDISCTANAGGRLLSATAIPTYGPAAGCRWRLPKHSHGKTLEAALTVTLDGATATHTFTAKIS